MAKLTSADIDNEYDLYYALIATMEYDTSASALAIYKQRAENELKAWYSARLALLNIEASAADNYSSAVGTSVTKKKAEAAQASVDAHWAAFVRMLEMGGVTVPSTGDESIALWDMAQ